MSAQASNRSTWLFVLAVAAAAFAFLALVYFPTGKRIRAVKEDIRMKREFIAQTDELRPTIMQLERDVAEVERYAQEFQKQAPAPEQLANLFGQMTAQVRAAGATTLNVEPGAESALAMLRRAGVTLKIAGNFRQICQVIAALEQMPQPFWVEEVDIERGKAGQAMQGGLKIEVFAANPGNSD